MIIWENGTDYLYEDIEDPLESLYPYYYSNTWVNKTIKEERPFTEYARLNSRIYQYNSIVHRVLSRYFGRSSFVDETIKGYLPLKPKTLKKALELSPENISSKVLSETKVERFRKTLERAKKQGVRLIVVDSPKFKERDKNNLSAVKMKEICQQYGVTFLDNSQLTYFLEHPELFNDATHMNDDGAKIYTELFLKQI